MSKIRVIYIAGKYRGPRPIDIKRNIRRAEEYGELLLEKGVMPITPHLLASNCEGLQDDQWFLDATLEVMRRCDAVFLIPGWKTSEGACGEREEAIKLGLPVFEHVKDLELWLKDSAD